MNKQSCVFFSFFYIVYLNFWLCWIFVPAQAFFQLQQMEATLYLQYKGFSLLWLLLLRSAGSGFSICGTWAQQLQLLALQHRFSSYGAWTQLPRGMWKLPGPGIKPVSLGLVGGFFTTEYQGWGNSYRLFFWAAKSLQMVTAAMKLKDAYSLEEKL